MLYEMFVSVLVLVTIFGTAAVIGMILDKLGLITYPEDEYETVHNSDRKFIDFRQRQNDIGRIKVKTNYKSDGKFSA